MKTRRTTLLLRVGLVGLLIAAAVVSGVNFVLLSKVVRDAAEIQRCQRALTDSYRALGAVATGEAPNDAAYLAARQADIAARSHRLATSVGALSDTSVYALRSAALVSFGALFLAILFAGLFFRRIGRPVEILLEAKDHYANGELDYHAPVGARGEMGDLVDTFGRVAGRLKNALDELNRQRSTVESRVRCATADLRTLSLTDELTNLPNLRHLREVSVDALRHASETRTPLLLVLIELDDFKSFNDTFGREAGDLALVAVARCLRSAAREVDFVSRYGGIRFAVLMPGVPAIPDEFRGHFRTGIDAVRKLIHRRTGMDIALNVSIGAGQCPEHGDSLFDLARVADRELQESRPSARDEQPAPTPAAAQG